MGLVCVKSITFSGNTLLPTSFVVFDLKRTNNGVTGYLHFQQIGRFLVPKKTFWTFLAFYTLMNGTILALSPLHLLEAHCLQQVVWFPC